jgi:uncharacterized protein YecE (DUF72 family)
VDAAARGPWIGTSGFSYPDWVGPVYPRERREHPLAFLARYVDLVEVNTSHYRIPEASLAREWVRLVGGAPRFRFTAKLWRGFTHEPVAPTTADVAAQRAFLDALGSDGRLLAALAQFPPWFRASSRNEAVVVDLALAFEGVPLAVEMRDASWDRDDVRAAWRERGLSWVVADVLPGPRALPPTPLRTAPLAYLRFHGRSAAWYEPGVGRDLRYDHLYAPEALAPWVESLRRLVDEDERVVVAFNNHPRGQALANALQMTAAFTRTRVPAPESLLGAYPRLAEVAKGDGLFG